MAEIKNTNINLPVDYSVASFDDERFLKLRVKVMHTGLNLNNSVFGLEAVEKAMPTIANIPLLAFVKKVDGEEGGDDFAGHEYEIKITQDGVKFVYLGRPIGIIPESNNYKIEMDEEGKLFVVVDGYVWRDYANSALDIIERDSVKKVSMEIIVKDYNYEDTYVEILDFAYTGIALLGEDVNEAMIGAKAEVVKFSADSITSMMMELKEALEEVGTKMETEVEVETEVEAEMEVEVKVEKEVEVEAEMEVEKEVEIEFEDETLIDEATGDLMLLQLQINSLESEIKLLKEENQNLKEYKSKVEKELYIAQAEQLLEQFSDLPQDIINSLKQKNLSIEDLETHLFAERGKLTKPVFSQSQRINVYGINNKTSNNTKEPIYADLIRQYKEV